MTHICMSFGLCKALVHTDIAGQTALHELGPILGHIAPVHCTVGAAPPSAYVSQCDEMRMLPQAFWT